MSYNDILPRYAETHRRCVLLGLHIREDFPSDEDEPVHAVRDHLMELEAQLWEDMRQGVIPDSEERAVPADVVSKRDVGADHEEETRTYEVAIGGDRVVWDRKETRLTEAAAAALAEVSP